MAQAAELGTCPCHRGISAQPWPQPWLEQCYRTAPRVLSKLFLIASGTACRISCLWKLLRLLSGFELGTSFLFSAPSEAKELAATAVPYLGKS